MLIFEPQTISDSLSRDWAWYRRKRWLAFPSQLLAAWLLLPTIPTHTPIPWPTRHESISKFKRNTVTFEDSFKSFKNILSGPLRPVFNGLHLTLLQTLTVRENGFSSVHSCTGNVWGFTTEARIPGQGENSNASTSALPEQGEFSPLLAKSSLKASATVPKTLYN